MHAFAQLYAALDETTKTNDKVAAMVHYFSTMPAADAAWALYFLSGRKPKQAISAPKLHEWAAEAAGIPQWLFEESYDAVGDLAEAMALVIDDGRDDRRRTTDDGGLNSVVGRPSSVVAASVVAASVPPASEPPASEPLRLSNWVENILLPLRKRDEAEQKQILFGAWRALGGTQERFVFNKLITSAFRVGVSQKLVMRALAEVGGLDEAVVAHRLMGEWKPTPEFYAQLLGTDTTDADISKPYPFFLAYPIEEKAGRETRVAADDLQNLLGDVGEWQIEWKWDGIRAQVIRRAGQTFVWSRGEENITERFPEIVAIGDGLPDGTVLDGEIVPYSQGHVLPFAKLQQRIGRKTLTKKILSEVPVELIAYDLLEWNGEDSRERPMTQRRAQLGSIVAASTTPALQLSRVVEGDTWAEIATAREGSREINSEGLMLKRKNSPYGVGRIVGLWWKWKVNPYTVDCVLINAQRGHGRRASLYSDYTFGVWDGQGETRKLVPFAKAYSGLTDAEIGQVDAFVRRNTLEKFGPVRTVKPELVFELAFEGIQRSSRHKSGIAVRFPRILRWRKDKPMAEADSIQTIQALLPGSGSEAATTDG